MQGVILAAGKGSRLHPITLNRSKAMLPILGKPMVERVMAGLAVNGVKDFILVVSPDDQDITRYFQNESQLAAGIRFVTQPERKGMADALQRAAPFIRGDFILSACDNLVPVEHVRAILDRWAVDPHPNAVLSLMEVEREMIGRTGIVEIHGPWVTRIVEKPKPEETPSNISSLPLYCFHPTILEYLEEVKPSPRGEYELQDAIQMLIERQGRVCGVMAEHRLTLTSPADLLAINRHYLAADNGHPQLAPRAVGPGTRLIPPLYIESGALIGAGCTIGPEVYIERDCVIGNQVTIQRAVLLRQVVVEDGSKIVDQVVS